MYAMNHGSMHNSRKRRSEEDHYSQSAVTSPPLNHATSNASLHSNFGDQMMDVDMSGGYTSMGDMELTSPAHSPAHSPAPECANRNKRFQQQPVDGYAHAVTMQHLRNAAERGTRQEPCAANGFTPSPAGLVEGLNCQQCDKDLAQDDIYYYDNYTCISCSSIVCRRCSISSIYRTDLYCLGCYSHGC
ncbi:hypothetical protein B0I73DRAFT_117127 [Yarrowia lipolytica]|uniref:YALI0B09581p n=2 Tax=Yarrowia lipolytica TaxID=4952 RepID=Q6CF77_YARLI|nr:YALI0B09581p [Yarrowia lipolytica CLIB122]KAB8280374.1 hypothetical protein BKA91DRAFT_103988 [Yarrowia lipolytica]KAE8169406.1 hypothetical protein BKA90DRAFT_159408 [Yarrowia lipolytica]KAJ8052287.1 hypothetical protein LXG23DRAFT_25877 [Yarrowia lipolytica]QNP96655.1 Hypothetical protein YALI2_C00308g [Yarrowia lipolytica]RDW28496.1 hypothetical protein B0I71DRAFT_156817 [Yarrowia lipolytica]|eukprot:XP_500685.1 YALI0B09581p [Yarrowia lipolytica CLIB122]